MLWRVRPGCRVVPLLPLLLPASQGEVHFLNQSKDYPHDEVISHATAYCYEKLVKDSACCVDEQFATRVARTTVQRPGSEWYCGDDCSSSKKGRRGEDVVWVPEEAGCASPRVLFIHGGSWFYGSPDTEGYGQLASKLAVKSEAVVMVPDYPLVPAGNYTTILAAVKSALIWLASSWNGCSTRPSILIGGDSAGGGTAMSLILEVKRHPEEFAKLGLDPSGKVISGGFFWSPWMNLVCDTPDYYYHAYSKVGEPGKYDRGQLQSDVFTGDILFQDATIENERTFQKNAQLYAGDYHLLRDPVASPMYAGERELAGGDLPSFYFACGASDSIMGDSVIFAEKAAAYGVEVSLEIFEGMWHDFPMYSEGCGSGYELWPAALALNHTAAHIRTVATEGHPWDWGDAASDYISTHFVYDRSLGSRRGWFAPEQAREILRPLGLADWQGVPPFSSHARQSEGIVSRGWSLCPFSLVIGAVLGAAGLLCIQRAAILAKVNSAHRESDSMLLE